MSQNPEHTPPADGPTRRGFLHGLATAGAVLGAHQALAATPPPAAPAGKEGLTVLNDRPWNMETPLSLLADPVTPNHKHFVRNNGIPPARAAQRDLTGWDLTIDGEVNTALTLTLDELKSRYEVVERALVLECGGNGRAGFFPPATGNQWTLGAVGCALYKGVRLRDVLQQAGVKKGAVYLAYHAEDAHLLGTPGKAAISRGIPIAKALDEGTLLAFEMNGEPLPAMHGWPLRLMAPGFPASASGKWLRRLQIRDVVHDGAKMTGKSYRVPRHPVAPGAKVADAEMAIIEEMPVKSLITRPATGQRTSVNTPLAMQGHAWSGRGDVKAVHLSFDFGQTWLKTVLKPPRNRWAWQQWSASVRFPTPGHYEIWCRATDETGAMQPMVVPGWNPKGYLNNAMQRIAVKVSG